MNLKQILAIPDLEPDAYQMGISGKSGAKMSAPDGSSATIKGSRKYDASLHPRYPKGTPKGGKFMPKGSPEQIQAVAKARGVSTQEAAKLVGAKPNKGKLTKFSGSAGAVGKAQKILKDKNATPEQRAKAKASIQKAAMKMRGEAPVMADKPKRGKASNSGESSAPKKGSRLSKFGKSAGAVGKAQKVLKDKNSTPEQRAKAKASITKAASKMRGEEANKPKVEKQGKESMPKQEAKITQRTSSQKEEKLSDAKAIPSLKVDLEYIDSPATPLEGKTIKSLANQISKAGDNAEPVILRQINPIKFEVVGDPTNYNAVKSIEKENPNWTEISTIVVQPNSKAEKAYLNQQKIASEVRQLPHDSVAKDTSTGKPTFKDPTNYGRVEHTRTYSVDLENITTSKGGSYSKEAVEKLAKSFVESGENLRPIVLRRTGALSLEVLHGNLEHLAALKAQEINPNFLSVRAYIVDHQNQDAIISQLKLLDELGDRKPAKAK